MKQTKTAKYMLAAALVTALFFAAVIPQTAFARGKVDTSKSCSLSFTLSEDYADLKEAAIDVTLYRVAEISADGEFTATGAFSRLDFSGVNSETSAADWTAYAEEAAALAKTADAAITLTNGSGKAKGLSTGLYLVCAADCETAEYGYTFSPYLISLPNNTYYTDGNDEWIYTDVAVSLKPERSTRYGSLSITKTLQSYDTTRGTAVFVFDVEAVKDGVNVYSNVLTLSFDAAGQKTLTVEGLPAGAAVTVTEVYSGASYTAVSAEEQSVTIAADTVTGVEFTNDYDETLTYGTGVVNHFAYDGSGHWSWQQLSDNE